MLRLVASIPRYVTWHTPPHKSWHTPPHCLQNFVEQRQLGFFKNSQKGYRSGNILSIFIILTQNQKGHILDETCNDVIEKLAHTIHKVIEKLDEADNDTPNTNLSSGKLTFFMIEADDNVKEVLEDWVEKVDYGDVKTEPEESSPGPISYCSSSQPSTWPSKASLQCFYCPVWTSIPWNFKDSFKVKYLSQLLHSISFLCLFWRYCAFL